MIRYPDHYLRSVPLRRLMDRLLEDIATQQSYQEEETGGRTSQAQSIPVNVFQTPDQIVIVAPMPGIAPEDIEVHVTHDTVQLKSGYRGPHQEEQDYVVREWSYGPYERTIRLAAGVDAERANASYNNGVLVLNLPKRDVTRAHRVRLQTESSGRGLNEVRSGTATLKEGGGPASPPQKSGAPSVSTGSTPGASTPPINVTPTRPSAATSSGGAAGKGSPAGGAAEGSASSSAGASRRPGGTSTRTRK